MTVLGWILIIAGGTCLLHAFYTFVDHFRDFHGTMSGDHAVPPPLKLVIAVLLGSVLMIAGGYLTGEISGDKPPAEHPVEAE